MDCLPSYSPPTASKHEQTLVVSSQLSRILGCDLTEAKRIWENAKRSETEKDVQLHLEMTGIFKTDTDPSKIIRTFQLIQQQKQTSTCMIAF
ncbi:unnamed protein product [Caenorhabditis brenneri]